MSEGGQTLSFSSHGCEPTVMFGVVKFHFVLSILAALLVTAALS